jgi:uncharacterized repeat protein (TIGR01451 family)
MKNSIKFLAFSFVAFAMFALANTANSAFNTNVAGQDCIPAVGIARAGQSLQTGCASYSSQEYASAAGQSFDVRMYYRNTGPTDATGVTMGMNASSSTGVFSAFLNSSAGGVSGTANLTLPSNSYLEFNGAKVYQRQGANNPVVIKEITTLNELANFSVSTIPSYTKCPRINSFCYQGIFVATFTVKQDAPQQICTDRGAINYGGPFPCNYYQPPQTCTDPNALNFGGPFPCVPRPVQQQCSVSLFASPNYISSGQPTTLSWTSNGCSNVTVYPNIGNVAPNQSGTRVDYPSGSINYTITGYGINTATANAIVTVGQVTKPVCSDNVDNDGDGRIDANDPGCFDGNIYNPNKMSEYNVVVTNNGPTASTLAATGISNSTCSFNGIVRINDASSTNAYFKYGTSASNLIYTTAQKNVGTNSGNYQFADTVTNLAPNTIYFYKVVATNSFGTKEGELRGCTTRSNTVVNTVVTPGATRTVVRPIVNTLLPEERIVANSAPSLLFLRIDDRREDLTCSDVVDYQVVYKNVSNLVLQNAILEVQMPAGVNYVKSSSGGTYSATTKTVTFNIGTVMPNQEDAKFIQADVDCRDVDSDMLVANASMVYTNPTTTAQEEAVAYDLDKFFNSADGRTSLTGAAIFGGGFLPNSLLGWLVMILVILGLAYLVKIFLVPVAPRRNISRTDEEDRFDANHN